MKKLFLIDASNMFFRAYYAIRPLSNSKGLPTNALYGYMSMTTKLLKEVKPDYMAYCYDSKEDGFREELYPEYKANRSEPPEDLIPQFPYFQKISSVLGIPSFQIDGVEADDIIGTLTEFGVKNGVEVVIVSGDKDFAQLIGPTVKMYDTMKDIYYDVNGVKEKWGVRPDQIIDYLSLVGDASDNIPGVEGVGQKTAQKLLDEHNSLDEIYSNIESVKPEKLREKLSKCKEMAYLSKKLVSIQKDVPLKLSLDVLRLKPVHREEVTSLLEELEFKTFERKILGSNDSAELKKEVSLESSKPSVSSESVTNQIIDWSAPDLDKNLKINQSLWVLPDERSLYFSDEKNIYCIRDSIEKTRRVLDEKKISWQGFDLKSFWRSLKLTDVKAGYDHQIAYYVLNAGNIGSFAEVYEKNMNIKLPEIPEATELLRANIELKKILLSQLEEKNGMKTYLNFDLPLVPILHSMEQKGVLIDQEVLKKMSDELAIDIRKLEKSIYEMAGETFNIASPKQLSHILFTKLNLTPIRKTKTGLSTDSDVLLKLELEHPIARLLIEYRELTKLKSTYVDALPMLIDTEDKRIHSIFHQTVTTTGRLSSSNPNLQNIPIRTERGNAIRKAFIAPQGHMLVSADYSQIELRILAHVTDDPGLVSAFKNDLDIHAATASEVFGVPLKNVTPDLRRIAKAVNFGLAYGMGAHGLAENLKISRSEASDIIKKYFAKFAKVKDYMTEIVEIAKKQGFVETIFGRRRYMYEFQSKQAAIRAFGERAAINAPMQGAAADIVKKAMIDLESEKNISMILQVHDELIFEVLAEDAKMSMEIIKNKMESAVHLKVPLKVNVASGPSWFDAH